MCPCASTPEQRHKRVRQACCVHLCAVCTVYMLQACVLLVRVFLSVYAPGVCALQIRLPDT